MIIEHLTIVSEFRLTYRSVEVMAINQSLINFILNINYPSNHDHIDINPFHITDFLKTYLF